MTKMDFINSSLSTVIHYDSNTNNTSDNTNNSGAGSGIAA